MAETRTANLNLYVAVIPLPHIPPFINTLTSGHTEKASSLKHHKNVKHTHRHDDSVVQLAQQKDR